MFPVDLVFKADPYLSQSLDARFRYSIFTDGQPMCVTDIASVRQVNQGVSFSFDRTEMLECSVTYGWPFGEEYFKNGYLSIPYGRMCPKAGGAYVKMSFPGIDEVENPIGLSFRNLYYEIPVRINGDLDVVYSIVFEAGVSGYSWPELELLTGRFRYESRISGVGHEYVRVPFIDDSDVLEVSMYAYSKEGDLLYGPEMSLVYGSELKGYSIDLKAVDFE